jgi:pyruvate dehydrogenase E2 component (dihydrolipoamide acetyltransferase)
MKIFHLPDLGEGLAEAEVREWYVKEGEVVKVDQPLVSMETAKAVVDVPSPYTGKIIKLHAAENNVVKTGAPFITFETEEKLADNGSVVGQLETSEKKWDESEVIVGSPKLAARAVKAMPAARVLAQQLNIDLAQINGTGPNGLITANDVKSLQTNTRATAMILPEGSEPLHGVRRVMAQAMQQSHREIVPVTIVDDADVTDLPVGTDLTAQLLKAIAAAVKVEPALNAWFDGSTLARKIFAEVNVGMAVDTPEGLFVPVIKDVQAKSLGELRQIIDSYKISVKDRSIAASAMQGGTITLSNFGTIAGRYATPIIVPPMVAILGCGKMREVPLVKKGDLVVGKSLPFSLTFDHRAVTGGEATRFLNAIIQYLQTIQ